MYTLGVGKMKNLIIGLILLIVTSVGGLGQASPSHSMHKALTMADRSSVIIYVKTSKNPMYHRAGTGWFWRSHDVIVTAKHVVEEDVDTKTQKKISNISFMVETADGETAETGMTPKKAQGYDVAILMLDHASFKKHYPLLKFAKKDIELGDIICGVGYDLDYNHHAFVGYMTGYRQDEFTDLSRWGICSAVINPGHSGSAALNEKGELVGMMIAHDARFYRGGYPVVGSSFYVPLQELKNALHQLISN